jgi:hypothetical protein
MKKSFNQFAAFAISTEQCKAVKGGISCSVTIGVGGGQVMDIGGACASSSMNDCMDYAENLADMYSSMGERVYAATCHA